MSQVDSVCADKTCLNHMYNTSVSNQHMLNNYMVPTKKIDSNSRTFQDFFHFFQDFWHQSSRTFPGLLTKFQDFSGFLRSYANSSNKIYFLQNKNTQPVVYINNNSFNSKNKNKYLS